jgi:hypothetical protein
MKRESHTDGRRSEILAVSFLFFSPRKIEDGDDEEEARVHEGAPSQQDRSRTLAILSNCE